ncbi:MAG TPA: FHA domain-containing protein [Pyrinomonadaceae bacterium]
MIELWLKYIDENGDRQRVLVESERFVVGRHSANDLSIPNEKISREHLKIERRGDRFVAADCYSSNGTSLNGENLIEPTFLKNGDKLNLGGGLEIEIEIVSAASATNFAAPVYSPDAVAGGINSPTAANISTISKTNNSSDGGIPMSFFYLAPLFGLGILLFLGAIVYVSSGSDKTKIAESENDIVVSRDEDDVSDDEPETNLNAGKTPRSSVENSNGFNSISDNSNSNFALESDSPPSAPKNLPDTVKIEQNSTAFLRRIAQNDPKAFLTSERAQIVDAKIKQLRGSSALADNIKAAKAKASQLQALAISKNMKPQFLAVAALTKLGNNRGDVLAAAQSMTDVLEKLDTHIGSELADDSLLVIAAYDQGAAGDFLKMRNMLQQLSNQFPESSRTIRSVWFLHKNGKISDAQFDFAERFLAIGTITQNPKDFNVNAEELKLN